jgi:hypothetical protein
MNMQKFTIQENDLSDKVVLRNIALTVTIITLLFFLYFEKYFRDNVGFYKEDNYKINATIENIIKKDLFKTIHLTLIKNNTMIDFSKYIPKKTAILFLTEEEEDRYAFELNQKHLSYSVYPEVCVSERNWDSSKIEKLAITIFLSIADNDTFIKANEVAKELKEKYGVAEVNLFALL